MKINYWKCKYQDYDDCGDGERYYGCKHPKNTEGCCKDNKWGDSEDECPLAEKRDKNELS